MPPAPKPSILTIAPYIGGASSLDGRAEVLKLSSNESPLGPSPKAIAAYREAADTLHRYPDGGCALLRHAIASRHNLPEENIVCGAGSDELIGLLVAAYAGPGDEVLSSQYGFLMYDIYAKLYGATPAKAPEKDLCADIDALLAAVTERTRIVFLANPNNPTGSALPRSALQRLRAGLREDILLVIDAAYAECVDPNWEEYEDGTALVAASDNTVMTRTFSKAYGLAGLRLGWAFCPPAIADTLNRARSPFNVNRAAQAAGIAALEDQAFLEKTRALTRTGIEAWRKWGTETGLTVHPSQGNFVLLQFASEAQANEADKALKEQGIIIRKTGNYGLPHCLRGTIGEPDQNARVQAALLPFTPSAGA